MIEQPVSERIKILLERYTNGNKAAMGRALGISGQAIADLIEGKKGGPSFPVLQKMLTMYSEIRAEWLILGEGDMLKPESIHLDLPDMNPADLKSVKDYAAEFYRLEIHPILAARVEEVRRDIKAVDAQALQMKMDEEARFTVYSVIGAPKPKGAYDGLLTIRLGITEEEAIELVNEGKLKAWYIGRWRQSPAGWRTNELFVREYLREASENRV